MGPKAPMQCSFEYYGAGGTPRAGYSNCSSSATTYLQTGYANKTSTFLPPGTLIPPRPYQCSFYIRCVVGAPPLEPVAPLAGCFFRSQALPLKELLLVATSNLILLRTFRSLSARPSSTTQWPARHGDGTGVGEGGSIAPAHGACAGAEEDNACY